MQIRNLGLGLAAAICCAGPSALAGEAQSIWDGTLQITAATSQCDAAGFNLLGTTPAYYRAKIKLVDPKAAVMVGTGDKQVQLEDTGANHTMSGAGSYKGTFMNAKSGVQAWTGGTYNFTLDAPTTTASRYIKVTMGTVTNFAGIPGCDLTVRAGFVKRAPSSAG